MKTKKILIASLLVGFIIGLTLSTCFFSQNNNKSVVKTIYDSIPYFDTIKKPNLTGQKINYSYKDSTILNLTQKDSIVFNIKYIDSILEDYVTERSYLDSFIQDSSTKVLITSLVQYNQLIEMQAKIINYRPIGFVDNSKKNKISILAGGTCSIGQNASIMLDVGVDYNNNLIIFGGNKNYLQLGYFRKFNFKTK